MSDAPIVEFEQVITPVTPAQVKATCYTLLGDLQASTTNYKPGSLVRLMIAIVSILASAISITAAQLARSAFLQTSAGAWRRIVARFNYHTIWQPATFATGIVVLTNTEGGEFADRPAYATIVRNQRGKLYRNSQSYTLHGNSTVSVPFVATEAGTASNTGVGTVTLVTTMQGVTASNTTAFVGSDDESDESLYARALTKTQSLSPNGARGAYEWFASAATRTDSTNVGVNRVTVSNSSTSGTVVVVVASSLGAVSGAYDDPATDLGAVYQSIVQNCLPGGVTLQLLSATAISVSVSFWAYFDRQTISVVAQQAVGERAITAWFSSVGMPIGGVTIESVCTHAVLRDTMRDILSDAFVSAGYPRPTLVRIYSPAADITLTNVQVPAVGAITAVQI